MLSDHSGDQISTQMIDKMTFNYSELYTVLSIISLVHILVITVQINLDFFANRCVLATLKHREL